MKYYQYAVLDESKSKEIATFFVDEKGEVDEHNLPDEQDISNLLKLLMTKKLSVIATGIVEDDNE